MDKKKIEQLKNKIELHKSKQIWDEKYTRKQVIFSLNP
jgi:hypothetical protein